MFFTLRSEDQQLHDKLADTRTGALPTVFEAEVLSTRCTHVARFAAPRSSRR